MQQSVARAGDRKLATALVSLAAGGTYTCLFVLTDLEISFFGTDFLLAAPFAIAGYLVNRWHVLVAPFFAWVPYAVGVDNSWWGAEVTDGLDAIIAWEIGVGCAAAGVVIWVRERLAEGRPPIC